MWILLQLCSKNGKYKKKVYIHLYTVCYSFPFIYIRLYWQILSSISFVCINSRIFRINSSFVFNILHERNYRKVFALQINWKKSTNVTFYLKVFVLDMSMIYVLYSYMQRTTQAQYSVKYSKKYTVSTQEYHLTFLNENEY